MNNLERACLVMVLALAILIALADAKRLLELQSISAKIEQLNADARELQGRLADAESEAAYAAWQSNMTQEVISQLTGEIERQSALLAQLYGGQIAISDQLTHDIIELRLALGLGFPSP